VIECGIGEVGVALPAKVVPIHELEEVQGLDEAGRSVFDSLGVRTVRVATDGEAAGLVDAAAGQLTFGAGREGAAADALITISSRWPELFVASESTRLQQRIPVEVPLALSVGDLGCASVSAAILVAQGLLAANSHWQRVVITHLSLPIGPRRFRHPVTVNGDAAMAFTIEREARLRLRALALETDGEYWDLFAVPYRNVAEHEWHEQCRDEHVYSFTLAIESRNRFRDLIDRALAPHGLGLDDVDHCMMQNLSEGAFTFYEEMLGIEFAPACRRNLRRFGHLGPIDVILNLHTELQTGGIAIGDRLLVLNNAPVAAWSVMLLEVA
jgi:3-oxoacyl-[acyl-carrier-protein] synthase III